MLDNEAVTIEDTKAPMTPDEVCKAAENIRPELIAKEILAWLVANVEQYIDNNEKVFRMYLTVNSRQNMPESMKLQDLYMAVPSPVDENDDEGSSLEVKLLGILDAICERVHEILREDEDGLKKLFDRLIFFFEMTGFSRDVGPLVQKLDGNVVINELSFDPIPMSMQVRQPVAKVVDGEVVETGEKKVVKEITLPAGFGIEIEIDFWKSQQSMSMY